jgi:hypothetical protein
MKSVFLVSVVTEGFKNKPYFVLLFLEAKSSPISEVIIGKEN